MSLSFFNISTEKAEPIRDKRAQLIQQSGALFCVISELPVVSPFGCLERVEFGFGFHRSIYDMGSEIAVAVFPF
jgi:hypothetical protein